MTSTGRPVGAALVEALLRTTHELPRGLTLAASERTAGWGEASLALGRPELNASDIVDLMDRGARISASHLGYRLVRPSSARMALLAAGRSGRDGVASLVADSVSVDTVDALLNGPDAVDIAGVLSYASAQPHSGRCLRFLLNQIARTAPGPERQRVAHLAAQVCERIATSDGSWRELAPNIVAVRDPYFLRLLAEVVGHDDAVVTHILEHSGLRNDPDAAELAARLERSVSPSGSGRTQVVWPPLPAELTARVDATDEHDLGALATLAASMEDWHLDDLLVGPRRTKVAKAAVLSDVPGWPERGLLNVVDVANTTTDMVARERLYQFVVDRSALAADRSAPAARWFPFLPLILRILDPAVVERMAAVAPHKPQVAAWARHGVLGDEEVGARKAARAVVSARQRFTSGGDDVVLEDFDPQLRAALAALTAASRGRWAQFVDVLAAMDPQTVSLPDALTGALDATV